MPVAGAIVRLLGSQGIVAQALTGEFGSVLLRAPGPGLYRIRVDRIGQRGLVTDPFQLEAEQTLQRELVVESKPIELPPVVVTGKSQCQMSDDDRT